MSTCVYVGESVFYTHILCVYLCVCVFLLCETHFVKHSVEGLFTSNELTQCVSKIMLQDLTKYMLHSLPSISGSVKTKSIIDLMTCKINIGSIQYCAKGTLLVLVYILS